MLQSFKTAVWSQDRYMIKATRYQKGSLPPAVVADADRGIGSFQLQFQQRSKHLQLLWTGQQATLDLLAEHNGPSLLTPHFDRCIRESLWKKGRNLLHRQSAAGLMYQVETSVGADSQAS